MKLEPRPKTRYDSNNSLVRKASGSRPPSNFSSFPPLPNHLRAEDEEPSEYKSKIPWRETRTRESGHVVLLAKRLSNTTPVNLDNDDLGLPVGEGIDKLLVRGFKVLQRKGGCM